MGVDQELQEAIEKTVESLLGRGMSIEEVVEFLNAGFARIGAEYGSDGHMALRIDHETKTLSLDVEGWSKDPRN